MLYDTALISKNPLNLAAESGGSCEFSHCEILKACMLLLGRA